MLRNFSRGRLVSWWLLGVVMVFAASIAVGGPMTVTAGAFWLVAGAVPLAVVLNLWRCPPVPTVAELLNGVTPSQEVGRL